MTKKYSDIIDSQKRRGGSRYGEIYTKQLKSQPAEIERVPVSNSAILHPHIKRQKEKEAILRNLKMSKLGLSNNSDKKEFKDFLNAKYSRDDQKKFGPYTIEELVDFLNMTTAGSKLEHLEIGNCGSDQVIRNTKLCTLLLKEICKFKNLKVCNLFGISEYGLTKDILNKIISNNNDLERLMYYRGDIGEHKDTDPIASFIKKPTFKSIMQITYTPSTNIDEVYPRNQNEGIAILNRHSSRGVYREVWGEDGNLDRFIAQDGSLMRNVKSTSVSL